MDNSSNASISSPKKHKFKFLWIFLSILIAIFAVLLITYIIFLFRTTGNLSRFGQRFEIENGRVYFIPWQSCNAETERMHCSVTGDPYSWCHCEQRYDSKGRVLPMTADKPIVYLYPTEDQEVNVKLGYPNRLTTIYPEYQDGWHVKAKPNGDLIDLNTGNQLYALYWEGQSDAYTNEIKEGFVIKGEDTAEFLEEKLTLLGLNFKEREEFIIYWLPKLEHNQYNYVRFASEEEIEQEMPLTVSPQPDTIIRIRMLFKGLTEFQEVPEQYLPATPNRIGFTVVDWGGVELK